MFKTILEKIALVWTIAIVLILATCTYLIFKTIQLNPRPEVSADNVRAAVEHIGNNFPALRFQTGNGHPTDILIVATNLADFTNGLGNTWEMSWDRYWEAALNQEYPYLFGKGILITNAGPSKMEKVLRKFWKTNPQ